MKELVKTELQEAPEEVKDFFRGMMEDDRLRFIDAYMGSHLVYGAVKVLVVEFRVKDNIYFNEETYYLNNDIIQVECGIGEDFDNEYPTYVERIGHIEGRFNNGTHEIEFEKKQLT